MRGPPLSDDDRATRRGLSLRAVPPNAITALALWTYTSPSTNALRYLFPGVAAAAIFVIFPMLYTVGIGFTNYSTQNMLDQDTARAVLLDEATPAPDSARAFTLHASGDQFIVRVAQPDASTAAQSPSVNSLLPSDSRFSRGRRGDASSGPKWSTDTRTP